MSGEYEYRPARCCENCANYEHEAFPKCILIHRENIYRNYVCDLFEQEDD